MSSKAKIILNFGNSHVSASVFNLAGGKIEMVSAEMETLKHDLSQEGAWLESSTEVAINLTKRLNLKGEVHCILPGSTLLTKTIRIPHVEESKQKKIITFELSQKLPVPLSELIWDYVVIDDDGVEDEILAYAVKPRLVEEICEKLIEHNLNPVLITPAPVLDSDLIRAIHNRPKEEEQNILAINIGAKSTNLLFIDENGFLIRTISIGGNMLTQNISDQLAIPFEKAESLKKNYYSGQITLNQDDPNLEIIQKYTQLYFTRTCQEISRALLHYKRIKKGKYPNLILLTGRGSIIGSFQEVLSQSISLPASYLNPAEAVQVAPTVNPEMQQLIPFTLSEPCGLAIKLSNIENDRVINLLPKEKLSSLGFKKKLPWIASSMVILSLLPGPFLYQSIKLNEYLFNKSNDEKNYLKNNTTELEELSDQYKNLKLLEQFNFKVSENQINLLKITDQNQLMMEVLNFLQNVIEDPEIGDLWFDQLYFSSGGKSGNNKIKKLTLSGRYLVRLEDATPPEKRTDSLIELNTIKQNLLNDKFKDSKRFNKIINKTFSTEGKGDLFNRHFSHFEYLISIK